MTFILHSILVLLGFWAIPSSFGAEALSDKRSASQLSIDECFAQNDLSLNVFEKGVPAAVNKDGCLAKIVLFRGPGSRWSIDLCSPQISLSFQTPLDNPQAEVVYSGSTHCPKPLFEIDLRNSPKNTEHFEQYQKEVIELLTSIRRNNSYSENLASTGGQLLCLERVLQKYLLDCVPFKTPPAKTKTVAPTPTNTAKDLPINSSD